MSLRITLAVILVVMAFLFAGTWDYELALEEDARYTQMVCSGAWPDYKATSPQCGE